jgi:hypothetical protein
MKDRSCCGGFMHGKKKTIIIEALPPNPIVSRGVTILYLGAGIKEITGGGSGTKYYVSNHHRQLKVFPEDAEVILRKPYFIRKP